MTHGIATPYGDRPEIEAAAVTDHGSMQQMREWIMAHKLEAHRGCTALPNR
jgi:hypothetical protein